MRKLRRLDKILARIETCVVSLFLAVMVCFTLLEVVLRSLATHARLGWAHAALGAFDWSEPLVRLLVLWLTFIGASLVTRSGRHIRVDVLTFVFPTAWVSIRERVLAGVSALLCGILAVISWTYLSLEAQFGGTLFLGLPLWAGQGILPAGFALLTLRFLLSVLAPADAA